MRKVEVELEYQPYIDEPPVSTKEMFANAASADETTIKSWRPTWEKNVRDNKERFKSFCDNSIGKYFGFAHQRPVIIAGSGPSLKVNIEDLKKRDSIPLISCLHNFHFLEDHGCPADFYVSLDAGEVTIEEVYEGGSKSPDEYWALTKERTLFCYIGTSPRLLEKWQGEICFFNCPVPDQGYMKVVDDVEHFNLFVSNGGNVLGACLYISKAFLGASAVAFIGADFSFSYDKKFHSWNSKYDATLGHVLRVRDIFGLPVYTWRSYYNFKQWFEHVTITVPGIYYNCTEGGIFGAYDTGNIRTVRQMPLAEFIKQTNLYKWEMAEQALNPKTEVRKIFFT